MKLTKKAIKAINNKTMHSKLALALNYTEAGIKKLIVNNKNNGPLTTFTALETIRQETGLADKDILANHSVPSL